MKKYLVDTFMFNDEANKRQMAKLDRVSDPTELIKLFSHLINCQYKWMARITGDENEKLMSWWEPLYRPKELESRWNDSLVPWIRFINAKSETDLAIEIEYTGTDGDRYAASTIDIALQLNYHSIHHRAQIQMILRAQGLTPDFIDYIGTRYRKIT